MTEYRIYMLDGFGRHGSSVNFNCGTDDDAKAFAKGLLHPTPPVAEVWVGTRCIGRVYGVAAAEIPPPDRPAVYKSRLADGRTATGREPAHSSHLMHAEAACHRQACNSENG